MLHFLNSHCSSFFVILFQIEISHNIVNIRLKQRKDTTVVRTSTNTCILPEISHSIVNIRLKQRKDTTVVRTSTNTCILPDD